jgi:hypothetical protein
VRNLIDQSKTSATNRLTKRIAKKDGSFGGLAPLDAVLSSSKLLERELEEDEEEDGNIAQLQSPFNRLNKSGL